MSCFKHYSPICGGFNLKRTLKNPSASILARLRNVSKERGLDHTQVLTQFAVERLLYRLSLSPYKDRFLLKGAMLYVIWGNHPFRTTRDLDLLGYGDITPQSVKAIFQDIARVDAPEDCIKYFSESVQVNVIKALEEYAGVRVILNARIDRVRISVQVDVGVGDSVTPQAEYVSFPSLLALPEPRIHAYPKEVVIAEKLHAIWKLGMLNTRMKDYYDIFYLVQTYQFEASRIVQSLKNTFQRREASLSSELPVGLSPEFFSDISKQLQWKAFLRKVGLAKDAQDIGQVICIINSFVEPLLENLNNDRFFAQKWNTEKWIN